MGARSSFLINIDGQVLLKQNRLKMKGLIDVTDNDWFAFLSQQPEIDEVNFLPKTARQNNGG
jgi:hypothetical protein